jgi:hypothetical protein
MGMQFKILSAELRLMTHITLIKESTSDGAFMPKFTILLASDKWLKMCLGRRVIKFTRKKAPLLTYFV